MWMIAVVARMGTVGFMTTPAIHAVATVRIPALAVLLGDITLGDARMVLGLAPATAPEMMPRQRSSDALEWSKCCDAPGYETAPDAGEPTL